MSIRAARYARLAAAVHTVPQQTWAVPKPAAPSGRHYGRQSARIKSTKYWRDLLVLNIYGRNHQQAADLSAGSAFYFSNLAGPERPGKDDGRFNIVRTTIWAKTRHGKFGSTFQRTSNTSHVISSTGYPFHDVFFNDVSANLINEHGMTMLHWGVGDGNTGSLNFGQGGSWNSADGFACSMPQTNAGYSTSAQNGTGSRGFGDVASTQFAAVSTLAAGERYVGFNQWSRGGHLVAAGLVWDPSGQSWKAEADISGTFSAQSASPIAYGWGIGQPIAGGAIWKGCPISWREFLRDIVHKENPADIFYG